VKRMEKTTTRNHTHPTNLVPVVRELPADLETPVSVYLKLSELGPGFLLESVTGGEQVARYSFIGAGLTEAFVLRGQTLEHHSADGLSETTIPIDVNPADALRSTIQQYRPELPAGLPRFVGGLVGYLGYEMMRYFEPSLASLPVGDLPDAVFLQADTVIAFDHAFGRLVMMTYAETDGDEGLALQEANERLDRLQERLAAPLQPQRPPTSSNEPQQLVSNMSPEKYCRAVEQAKEYIAAGDIFQVVVSQRFSRRTTADAFSVYRALRALNPSPYMFFFNFTDFAGDPPLHIIGASPEMHVRLEGDEATIRPLAGTRPRWDGEEEDNRLEQELLADPKERAEHVMLVDLARNDLGRVCDYGSVHVPIKMAVERYSHVMHIVSQVQGNLKSGYDAFDLMAATFPAGTVSGAPKIRAMEIIAELEGESRGPYAGAIGYFSYDGSLDSCIAIRTLVMQGDEVHIQAGAGLVADSVPERELQETIDKASALAVALEMAEKGQI
jgi:anthranilate synthase component 1